jgi:hypothetical protein
MIICIVICQVYDVYYYVIEIIGKPVSYIFEYLREASSLEGLAWFPEVILNSDTRVTGYYFEQRDRYHLLYPIFFPFLVLRVFIIKEPTLFFILHVFLIISYLQDKNLFYTYIYTLTVTYK